VLAVVAGRAVALYSRNGKELTNFPQIAQAISDIRRIFLSHPTSGGRFVLDGEILGESFQALMRQARRKHDAKTTGMVYHVFDFVPLDDFERGYWNMQQRRRTDMLDRVRASVESTTDCVRIMPGVTVDLDTAEGHDIMRRFAADAVAQGYEGIMIKDLGAPYQCKRSSHWMKWKPTITVDLAIVGFEEGTGRNAGRLGALICEGVDDGRNIRVNVGSGLSDQDREQYWNDRESLLDHVVEIEADAVTQNQDGTHSLRFPRFVRFRGFGTGEKL
jgi:DNA ligase-1